MAVKRAQGWRHRGWPLRRRSPHLACILTAARVASQPRRRCTQPAILSTAATNPRRGATFLRLSAATSGYAPEDAAVIAIRSPGGAAPLRICCRSTTRCRSPRAAARTCSIYIFSALPITACARATGRLRRRCHRCSASSALLARRSTRLADGLQVDVAGRDTLRISARRACIFAAASSDPGRGSPAYEPPAPGDRHHRKTRNLRFTLTSEPDTFDEGIGEKRISVEYPLFLVPTDRAHFYAKPYIWTGDRTRPNDALCGVDNPKRYEMAESPKG